MIKNIAIALLVCAAGFFAWRLHSGGLCGAGRDAAAVVIVARADLEKGTVLTQDLMETRTVPRAYVQQEAFEVGAMTDINVPVGMTAAVRIPKGDQLTRNCLAPAVQKGAAPASDNKLRAQERYLEGLKYFQNSNYPKARAEWQAAQKLDPKNADAAAGLKRISQIEAAYK